VNRSRWISLAAVALCLVVDFLVLAPLFESEAPRQDSLFPGQRTASFLLLAAFVCIWWPDIVGAALVLARFGPVPDSWAVIVRVLGWGLLLGGIVMRIDLLRQPMGS